MYEASLISADFEESTMEFEIKHEFTVRAGDYVIMTKDEYEKINQTNGKLIELLEYIRANTYVKSVEKLKHISENYKDLLK